MRKGHWIFAFLLSLAAAQAANAQMLEFTRDASDGRDFALRAIAEESGVPTDAVSVAYVDLNQDGRDDMFVFAESSYFCGSAGCDPRIFVATKKGWRPVAVTGNVMINSAPGMWFLTNTQSGGWLSLALEENGVDKAGLVWRGEAYEAIRGGL